MVTRHARLFVTALFSPSMHGVIRGIRAALYFRQGYKK